MTNGLFLSEEKLKQIDIMKMIPMLEVFIKDENDHF